MNLHIATAAPLQIFEAFQSFIAGPNKHSTHQSFSAGSAPTQVRKAQLLLGIHEVEDVFVAYAEDTIDRVIADLKKHRSQAHNQAFKVRKSYAQSCNLLVNDI